ncbi:HNH endonuclease [Leptolyngbyaceae cyanobacterium CCMR0082]|uniref:HNH endonuclease n=2 Tax=Adonisia turfae TaxID=2950184 RepID=A0A6M0SFL8_9CYAN|nr:HNH endonuclease [Adonisia turfae CCMR0081]NEZ67298.1 HNH endonuclease [Adonisia turfae CCMR0082]
MDRRRKSTDALSVGWDWVYVKRLSEGLSRGLTGYFSLLITFQVVSHTCGECHLAFIDGEKVHLHHIDGDRNNWAINNCLAVHESCHDYIHMGKR